MFEKVWETLTYDKKIVILPHKNADGDCLGSAFALKLALCQKGYKAEVVAEEESDLMQYVHKGEKTEGEFNLAIAVDCADEERLGTRLEIFNTCDVKINIDHHKTNTRFADINIVDSSAAATGEMIYALCEEGEIKITPEIADNLYLALLTDTGRFTHKNTTAKTHAVASKLVLAGADFNGITINVYGKKTRSKLLLEACAISSMKLYKNGEVATISITKSDIESVGAIEDEASGLVDIPVSLDSAKVSLYFKETDDGIKVSMRSSVIDVAKVATIFGGGGHTAAAGCTLSGDIESAEKKMVDIILEEMI